MENFNRQTSNEHKLYKNIEGRYSDLDYKIKVNIIDRETAIKQKEHEKYQMQSIDVEISELSRQRKHLHSKAANVDINNICNIDKTFTFALIFFYNFRYFLSKPNLLNLFNVLSHDLIYFLYVFN